MFISKFISQQIRRFLIVGTYKSGDLKPRNPGGIGMLEIPCRNVNFKKVV